MIRIEVLSKGCADLACLLITVPADEKALSLVWLFFAAFLDTLTIAFKVLSQGYAVCCSILNCFACLLITVAVVDLSLFQSCVAL